MANRPRTVLSLAMTLAALGATGCGSTSTQSGSGQAATSAETAKSAPTRAQFVAQAENICRMLSSQEKPLKARQESLKGLSTASYNKAFVAVANQVVALSRTATARLQALPRPPGDAKTIEKALAIYSEEVTDVANISYDVANQESSAGEAAVAALKRSIANNSGAAESFGLKGCSGAE